MTGRIVFVDTETTGTDPNTHEVWEVALIERRPDGDHKTHLYVKPQHLGTADPDALQINRFYERTHDFKEATSEVPGPGWMGCRTAAKRIARITAGAVLVGSNPAFDAAMLGKYLRSQNLMPAWHYRQVCVATMAYGYLHGAVAECNVNAQEKDATIDPVLVDEAAEDIKFKSYQLARACSIEPPAGDDAHTAMADVKWVRDWYDALIRGAA